MSRKCLLLAVFLLALQAVCATPAFCPNRPECTCRKNIATEIDCIINGHKINVNLFPTTYVIIKCKNITSADYEKFPKFSENDIFQSVSFQDCPLPLNSFKNVLQSLGVNDTKALIYQNTKKLSGSFDKKHFAGLEGLRKLLLSTNGVTYLPDDLFEGMTKLKWLNIRSSNINLTAELFKPLERLETLEISHNRLTNATSSLFSHLSFLRKLSLWQSNVTWFSGNFFSGVDVLEELDLSSSGLNELPSTLFGPLKNLRKITLFSNKFRSLPTNLFRTNSQLETVIVLSNNVKMNALPAKMLSGLTNLKEIYIQRCGLEDVSRDLLTNSQQVTNISLAYNSIEVLPESIFNDQINLLELDLSHNKLKLLQDKLFSSLVKLIKLDLSFNRLKQISSASFLPLLSLIHLSMDNNDLENIPSFMLSNNKQKISISLSYNKLDLENSYQEFKKYDNDGIKLSSFAHLYNLKLLNLSHNAISSNFLDLWFNGHDTLDISNNLVKVLLASNNSSVSNNYVTSHHYGNGIRKLTKTVWLFNNPLECNCDNLAFLNYMLTKKIKVLDNGALDCAIFNNGLCREPLWIHVAIIFILAITFMSSILFYIRYRSTLYSLVKNFFQPHFRQKQCEPRCVIEYCELDRNVVLDELMPRIQTFGGFKYVLRELKNGTKRDDRHKRNHADKIVVFFTSNYLISVFSDVHIKKIPRILAGDKNALYIFADSGLDDSMFSFIVEQRNPDTSVLWNERDFFARFQRKLAILNHNGNGNFFGDTIKSDSGSKMVPFPSESFKDNDDCSANLSQCQV